MGRDVVERGASGTRPEMSIHQNINRQINNGLHPASSKNVSPHKKHLHSVHFGIES
jgi:hypothetical protein